MARTASSMINLGTRAAAFTLENTVDNTMISLTQAKGRVSTIVVFICNHCPFVKHINAQLIQLAVDYEPKGVSLIAISANDALQYPDDGPEQMKIQARELGYPFPYLYDQSQAIAKAYGATCTPDFFVYDKDLLLVYRGQLDDSRPGNGVPVTGKDIRDSLDALIEGKQPTTIQKPSIGCGIKWKD